MKIYRGREKNTHINPYKKIIYSNNNKEEKDKKKDKETKSTQVLTYNLHKYT